MHAVLVKALGRRRVTAIAWLGMAFVVLGCGGSKAMTTGSESVTTATTGGDSDESQMQLFLLFGQSNMEGAPKPEAEDLDDNPRVRVLGYDDFGDRKWNEWAVARPPLHRSWAGVGPGDYFGKAMAEAWPETTIGLIPCAISGVDIDFFRKGVASKRRSEFEIPPDDSRDGAYPMLIERVRLAQDHGVVRGILFHQGESDTGNSAWVGKVAEIVADLRADLGLADSVPFLAGELLYSGCCAAHNPLVNELPGAIANTHVVSAADLNAMDNAHFDLASQRELGRRYADTMLAALGEQ